MIKSQQYEMQLQKVPMLELTPQVCELLYIFENIYQNFSQYNLHLILKNTVIFSSLKKKYQTSDL